MCYTAKVTAAFIECFEFTIQEMPAGHPNLVNPSLDKVDLPHLCSDIKKYKVAGVLSDADTEWWNQFLASFVQKYGSVPEHAPAWPVDEISAIVAKGSASSEPTPVIPDVILKLHSNEKQPSREVCVVFILSIVYTLHHCTYLFQVACVLIYSLLWLILQ